ncbi:hypothetical protein RDI58_019343 [Solanum bulbocastanum]|uniref:Uncharacterized protein n=1 Tax=Solanum bulbocastanum TaxID=147425 RepID=A0AAN8TAD3_SOLBU
MLLAFSTKCSFGGCNIKLGVPPSCPKTSSAEALRSDLIELLTDTRDQDAANNIVHRVIRGESWTGQFPVKDKQGDRFLMMMVLCLVLFVYRKAIKRSTLSDLNTSFYSKGPVRNKNSQHARVTQQWKTTASKVDPCISKPPSSSHETASFDPVELEIQASKLRDLEPLMMHLHN